MELVQVEEDSKEIFAFCNDCKSKTLHLIKTNYDAEQILSIDEEEKLYRLPLDIKYQVIECRGCLTVSFREVKIFPKKGLMGAFIPNSADKVLVRYFPERSTEVLTEKKFTDLAIQIESLYKEVIESYNNDLNILCAVGLRALVETICKELDITGKNLKEKIQNLAKSKHLGDSTANALDMHRFLGNEAIHINERPEKDELRTAILLLEHALKEIYSVPRLKEKLANLITKRITDNTQ